MAYLLETRRSALPIPKETGRLTKATLLLSSVKSCKGGHGLCHHLREKRGCPSSAKKERVMTMVIFFHTSVESCGGDNGISSREEVCPTSPKVIAYFQEKEEVCSSYS